MTIRKIKWDFQIILIVILCIILATYGYSYFTNGCNPAKANIFGYKLVYIGSESMEPTMNTGALVLCKMLNSPKELVVGDICNYLYTTSSGEQKSIIHRIVKMNADNTYTFKGDNNPDEDYLPVSAEQICSKYLFTLYNP